LPSATRCRTAARLVNRPHQRLVPLRRLGRHSPSEVRRHVVRVGELTGRDVRFRPRRIGVTLAGALAATSVVVALDLCCFNIVHRPILLVVPLAVTRHLPPLAAPCAFHIPIEASGAKPVPEYSEDPRQPHVSSPSCA